MSNYRPDNDATAGDPWNIAFLSDRDVSGQVPINFVPHPGVYLTPACFGNGTYEDNSFKACFSNLLASEFRRFILDVYWDVTSRQYRLCPVEIPSQSTNATAEAQLTSEVLNARQIITGNTTMSASSVLGNQTVPTTTSTSSIPVSTIRSASGTILYQLGPYQCSASLNFATIMAILSQFFDETSTDLEARLQYLIINLHASSTAAAPTTKRQSLTQAELPKVNELMNNYLNPVGSLLYTPFVLNNERSNLNSSWFSRTAIQNHPLSSYFTIHRFPNGDMSTPDGWPCENYVQLQQGWRMLLGYGVIGPEISDYNYAGDNSTIFLPGYLESDRAAKIDNSGSLASGCFYSSTANHVDQVNSSWAVSSIMGIDQSTLGYAADNHTTCGISPVLNYTLSGSSASVNYEPYQAFGNQALFSWASGEPKNVTAAGQSSDNNQWSCALMVSSDEYQGHWRVANCQGKRRVACREANQPYVWRLSIDAVPYSGGFAACTGNSTFDVPRTGLENLYLFHHVRSIATTQDDSSLLDGVWVNFNSLNLEGCWVTTGMNGTCPYNRDPNTIRQRTILVPTIAAFITLCITALTILVKCNTNRKSNRVRKRGEGGWDYEGVPS